MLRAFSQNNALHFDGTNDYVAIPSVGTNLNSFTIEAWINPETISTRMMLVTTDGWVAGTVYFRLFNGKVSLAVNGLNMAETDNDWPVMSAAININRWQHIAVTYDGVAKKIVFYLNSVESGSYNAPSMPVANFTTGEIGAFSISNPYSGKMDEVRIWNKSLTSTEINATMKTELVGTESGLIAYYNFNQGTASGANSAITTLTDITSNHYTGTLTNFSLLTGNTSNWVTGFVVPSAPGTPTNVSAVAGNLKAIVSFTVPTSDGGSPITQYTVTSTPGSIVATGTASPIVVMGLDAFRPYTFTVVASNVFGNSAPSVSTASVTPISALVITSITPTSGPVGTTVTITGSGFSTTAGNNIVYFGAVKATVSAASESSLTVTVPSGAGSVVPISIETGGFVAQSNTSSTPVFDVTNTPNLKLTYASTTLAGFINPQCITVGDFNGDSKPDMAVANLYSDHIDILLGNGNGTFTPASDLAIESGSRFVSTGDFNGDGKIDLVSANWELNSVSIFLGIGDGTFSAKTDFAVGEYPNFVAVGDFDGDGKVDIATANYKGQSISVLKGNGDGTFAAKTDYPTGSYTSPYSIAVGDFNGDGQSDIVVANFLSSNVGIFIGNGGGGFAAETTYPVGSNPSGVVIGDFNADGKADLASSNYNNASVSILMGNGDGTFMAKVDYPAGTNPISVSLGDFNGDGKLDLAIPNGTTDRTVSVLKGNGDGTFAAKFCLDLGVDLSCVATGDFNGDGKTDMAVASSSNSVIIMTSVQSPTVTTQAVTSITATSATGNGNIIDIGTANPTQYGVVWSTETNPTVDLTTKTELGAKTTTGAFISSITDLTPFTKYYINAYATNAVGTSYGSEVTFTTPAAAPSTPTEVAAIAGNAKATISFTAPDANGNPITSYIASSSPGSKTATGTASPLTVAGLTNGIAYTFTVVAINGIGTSDPSASSNGVTPFVDTENPTISNVPANISVSTDAGKNYAIVSWVEPTANDNVAVISFTSNLFSGLLFSVGETTVTYTATDADGNTATASFTVTVNDTEKPVISDIPANILVSTDAGKDYATVSWTEPTATDNVEVMRFMPDYTIDSQFAVGETTVTYTATDYVGNTETASFTVTVNDTEKPVISAVPANISINTDAGKSYATVSWIEPTANDNVGVTDFAPDHAIGSQFPVGITTVTYTATDAAGNTETASFTVTVTSTTGIDIVTSTEVNVYPNPVTDIVNITTGNSADNGTYSIVSISGTIVSQGIIANGKATANLENRSGGTYLVQIQLGSLHSSYRIVKR